MGTFVTYTLYFLGAQVSMNLLSKLNDKIEFVTKTINFVLITFVSAVLSISCSPYLILTNQRSSLNWLTGRTFSYLSKLILGISVEIENPELLEENKPYVFVGNHQSEVDLVWLGAVFPKNAVILAKKVVKYYPVLGWFMILADDIFISRGVKQSTKEMFKKASEDLLRKKVPSTNKISTYLAILIFIQNCVFFFPEGTKGSHPHGPDMLPFKKGAFLLAKASKVPIIPLAISDMHNIINPKMWRFKSGVIKVKVLPAILDSKNEDCDIDDIMKYTRDVMIKALLEISSPRV
ncbi:putative 1-acyl-sn-glycerol-3-phosphate acyltransferase [Smittium culicis]|uniref:Putative 1-acyl-sn-glycerol-3-phosphate acyltransferase n=1 Tax=Smittium culicis TaxID=133412 RepID=A0A1R1XE14_9FUNG|nr:putative 1-acyl-sn-glycerol-3-phosphate acyltransferase [Smittium culicis]